MDQPIGVFDSGVGGLSVLREIRARLPEADLLYVADQAHVPYGPRPLAQVREFAGEIARFLLAQGARVVVVACNTASAAALTHLRTIYPHALFVGMEPAVKPAARSTHSGVVGVLATPATFQGQLLAGVVARFAREVTVLEQTCPGLVEQIEAGELDSSVTRELLAGYVAPLVARGADTLVLGCTHYPFVLPLIEELAGPQVRVINPAPAVARQTERVWRRDAEGARPGAGRLRVLTSGPAPALAGLLPRLLGETAPVETVCWQGGALQMSPP